MSEALGDARDLALGPPEHERPTGPVFYRVRWNRLGGRMHNEGKLPDLVIDIVETQLPDSVQEYIFRTKPVRRFPCRVCTAPGARESSGGLCWICRRLKISAWRESEI